MSTRRLVTEHRADGKAIVVSDSEVAPRTISFLPGSA